MFNQITVSSQLRIENQAIIESISQKQYAAYKAELLIFPGGKVEVKTRSNTESSFRILVVEDFSVSGPGKSMLRSINFRGAVAKTQRSA
jgi:hypothetical protein